MARKFPQAVIGLGLVLFLIGSVSGCSRVHEPWVQSDDHLKQERMRSAQTQEALRYRIRGQADR